MRIGKEGNTWNKGGSTKKANTGNTRCSGKEVTTEDLANKDRYDVKRSPSVDLDSSEICHRRLTQAKCRQEVAKYR